MSDDFPAATPAALGRFKTAQDGRHSGFDTALAEIRAGRKRSHWIWYVFPQLAGLGGSATSHAYAIHDVAEAVDYLRDAVLRVRLVTITKAVVEQTSRGRRLEDLMGSALDAQKLVSSLTLFGAVAEDLSKAEGLEACASLAEAAAHVLRAAEHEGLPRCPFTLAALQKWHP